MYKVRRLSLINNIKILYLHGKDEEVNYPEGGIIYKTLSRYFNIDYLPYSSNPKIGYPQLKSIDLSEYDLLFGFSLGGVMASALNKKPAILLNPGYGLSRLWSEYTKVDIDSRKINPDLVKLIMICESDKYQSAYMPEIERRGLMDKVSYMPGKHVPEELDMVKYLIPKVHKIILNI